MDDGLLVPDDIIIGVLRQRLDAEDCADGYILDGVPRTIAQAQAIDQMGIKIDRVISMQVADDVILQRITGRRSCPACGASYHIEYKAPATADICDHCGELLVTRNDDTLQTAKKRLQVYHESTEKLLEYYGKAGMLYTVCGAHEISDTTRNLLKVLEL